MTQIVAVTGLSGVGKTTFLTNLKTRVEFQHLQSGNLIKAARELKTSSAILHDNLKNLDLDENQMLLVESFYRAIDPSALVVLDCHTMVEREDEYTLIPAPVFAALQINAIFVLVEQPKIIAARRAGDLGRERPVLPIREIGRRQEAAVNQAKAIAAELRISFQQMSPVDEEQCHDLLSSPIWDVNS